MCIGLVRRCGRSRTGSRTLRCARGPGKYRTAPCRGTRTLRPRPLCPGWGLQQGTKIFIKFFITHLRTPNWEFSRKILTSFFFNKMRIKEVENPLGEISPVSIAIFKNSLKDFSAIKILEILLRGVFRPLFHSKLKKWLSGFIKKFRFRHFPRFWKNCDNSNNLSFAFQKAYH